MKQYSKEFLLSFADEPNCRRLPDDLDPALSRDNPSPDIVDGGANKFTRREYSNEVPEWRSRPSANGGALLPHVRNSSIRSGLQGQAQGRWDHRNSIDRERDRGGRGHQQWEGADQESGPRRFGWNGSEHDGLLGSGGGLRGAYPARGPDRYSGGGRGARNQAQSDSRPNRLSAGGRSDTDSLDGETFGDKSTTEERVEEERRRRESFESMRKEQQRMKDQKKQEKLENANEDKKQVTVSKPDVPAPVPRPLVPPGFSQPSLHKLNVKKELKEEESNSNTQASMQHTEQQVNGIDSLTIAYSTIEDTNAVPDSRTSVIDKLFTKATTVEKTETSLPKASKFAHLFGYEDEKSVEFLSLLTSSNHAKPSGEIQQSDIPQVDSITPQDSNIPQPGPQQGVMLPMPAGPSLEDIEKNLKIGVEKKTSVKPLSPHVGRPTQTFLTCEDIEQSLLAEASSANTTGWSQESTTSGWKQEQEADSDASRHLLSLLQKASAQAEIETKNSKERIEEQKVAPTEGGVATLEALFGMSFMMELRSTDTPLSAKAVSESTCGQQPVNPQSTFRQHSASPFSQPVLDGKYTNSHEAFDDVRNIFKESPSKPTKDGREGEAPEVVTSVSTSVAAPANLYRSHSPPLLQKSSSLQLQQLQQALSSQGNKLPKGELDGRYVATGVDGRYGRVPELSNTPYGLTSGPDGRYGLTSGSDGRYGRGTHARAALPRQFPEVHGQFVHPGLGPSSYEHMYGTKQRPVNPHYFGGPNGLHATPPQGQVPTYGQPRYGAGFVGYRPMGNEGIVGDGESRWVGREMHGGIPGLFQQPMYGP